MVMYKTTAECDVQMTSEEEAQVIATQQDAATRKVAQKIADLWNAADRYIYQYINGVGIAILSAGVHGGQTRAKACAKWSDGVWAEYYARKNKLLTGEQVSFDFSDMGPMPHDVLELRAEIESLWIP